MTLVEFLLARLDEDQAAAERIETTSCEGVESAAEMDYFRFAERARSECEAKRRIVEWCAEATDPYFEGDYDLAPRFSLADDTLRALGLPFADHPDYREEWRP